MGATTRRALPYPDESTPNDVPVHVAALANALDNDTSLTTGTLAGRPGASLAGKFYSASDKATLYMDDGTQWRQIMIGTSIRLPGTLDGSGNGAAAHPFGSPVVAQLQNVQAFFEGNSGEAVPMTVTHIDGSGVGVTGGTAGRHFYVTMTVVSDSMPW